MCFVARLREKAKSDSGCNSYLHGGPCGFFSDPVRECTCSASTIARDQKRISGPLLDRIDVHVEVPRVDYEKLADKRNVENSETIRKRVQAARERQLLRFKGTKLTCNAEMWPSEVRDFCNVEPSAEKLLKAAMQQLHLSARTFHKVLRACLKSQTNRLLERLYKCTLSTFQTGSKAGTNDCRPGGEWGDCSKPCGGGDPVSATSRNVA